MSPPQPALAAASVRPAHPGLLTDLLRAVSRSFYLTLQVLPRSVRRPIGLAYLLARTTDTIADTPVLASERRVEALRELRARIAGDSARGLDLGGFLQHQAAPEERELLQRIEEGLALLERLPAVEQGLIREVLDVIASGQELDLVRFKMAGPGRVIALVDDEELDDYTWRVAGCVGRFWTQLCRMRLFPGHRVPEAEMIRDGIRFGKGLQLVNILRDLATDLSQGRCYLPADRLTGLGLEPGSLRDQGVEELVRPLYEEYLHRAGAHLEAGWNYTNLLPRFEIRVRLACAWPILIGQATLQRLYREPFLDPRIRVKVPRGEVRAILTGSILRLPFPGAWRRQFRGARS